MSEEPNYVPEGHNVRCHICMKVFTHSTDAVLHVRFEHPIEYMRSKENDKG